jgi:predicted  nucleic acid-binding Zn-ribbon protein
MFMTPEISHRCPSCGASIRDFGERAMFCPECGKPVASAKENSPNWGETRAEVSSTVSAASGIAASHDDKVAVPAISLNDEEAIKSESPERHGAREKTRETLHRASTAARGAIEHNVQRVKKVEHVSAVMLEEASSDPSLRFVLVALGLFVVFIILLVLSKVMG